jgi:hypothetical protein
MYFAMHGYSNTYYDVMIVLYDTEYVIFFVARKLLLLLEGQIIRSVVLLLFERPLHSRFYRYPFLKLVLIQKQLQLESHDIPEN